VLAKCLHPELSKTILQEVNSAARRMFDMPTNDASSFSSDSAEPSPVDSILAILITFLDMASSDLRNLASLVFGMVASSFTSSSIEHLVAVCDRSCTGLQS